MAHAEFIASFWTLAGDVIPRSPSQVSPFSFEERVKAAATAGFSGIGVMHDDLRATVARLGLRTMRDILADAGLVHLELEFLSDWFVSGERRQSSNQIRRELLDAAEALGARHIKVGGDSSGAIWSLDLVAQEFASLCREAQERGTSIVLELLPWTQFRTLASGLALMNAAHPGNGGLLLDAWHLERAGEPFLDIGSVPNQIVHAAELDDAGPPTGGLWDDTIHRRKLCGEGTFDLDAFIHGLTRAGFDGPYGVEIISKEHRKRPLHLAAKLAFETAKDVYERSQLHGRA